MSEDRARRRRRWLLVPLIVAIVSTAIVAPNWLMEGYDGPLSDHFDGRRFNNLPANRTIVKPLHEVLRWMVTREPGPWRERRDVLYYNPPERVESALRVTFVNHATVLIQTGAHNILTDPVWSDRLSPLPYTGPRRYRPPGIRFDDLPPIDVVLITHNHYDHMDAETIRALAETHDPLFVVPLGNTRYLARHGVDRIVELDWWDSHAIGELEIHAVPAQHWSRRGLYDTNRALWAGFVIATSAGPVYFAGDTGMGPHFERIRTRLGAPRLALLPIGAYLPRWFMAAQHIDPAEAVSAHVLLGAVDTMAIHFGTFKLGDDGQGEPVRDLRQALRAAGVAAEAFWIPGNGETRLFEPDEGQLASVSIAGLVAR